MQIYVVSDDDSGWFDLGTDPDELKQEISDQLGTDDWKIDDSDPQIDNIGRLTLEDLCEIAEIVDISAFVAWLNYTDDFDYVKDHFDEAYHGHYDTPSEFAEAYITGMLVHADNFDFLRESVQWFATVMEVVLRKNDHKGGWENEPFQYFIDRMRDELSEIEGAIANLRPSDGDLIDLVNECADLANFAMMLAENAHRKAMEWDEEECEHGRE